jgi:hypothetical protein
MDDEPLQDKGKTTNRKPRISMYEFANPGGGLACRKCGCRDFRVRDTRRADGFIRRYRVCRYCGTVRTTTEK